MGGRQPDTGSGVHGFEHVVDQLAEFGVELGHRLRTRAQPLIGEFQNGSDRHETQFPLAAQIRRVSAANVREVAKNVRVSPQPPGRNRHP